MKVFCICESVWYLWKCFVICGSVLYLWKCFVPMSHRNFLGFFIKTLFSFTMTELKNDVVCTYKMLFSDLVSE